MNSMCLQKSESCFLAEFISLRNIRAKLFSTLRAFIDEVKFAAIAALIFCVGSCFIYVSITPFEKLLEDIKV